MTRQIFIPARWDDASSFAVRRPGRISLLTRFSHRLTVEARDRRAITSLRLLAVLDVLSSTPPLVKQRAPRTDAPLTHFASPRGEKSPAHLQKASASCQQTWITGR